MIKLHIEGGADKVYQGLQPLGVSSCVAFGAAVYGIGYRQHIGLAEAGGGLTAHQAVKGTDTSRRGGA